jgi:hypothetical protein
MHKQIYALVSLSVELEGRFIALVPRIAVLCFERKRSSELKISSGYRLPLSRITACMRREESEEFRRGALSVSLRKRSNSCHETTAARPSR